MAATEVKAEEKADAVGVKKLPRILRPKHYKHDPEFKKLMKTTKVPTVSAARRPMVTVYSMDGKPTKRRIRLPDVMVTPIRQDLIHFVHTNMSKNRRQPYAVMNREGPHGLRAGHQVAAKSWGTGRAVSRVPRVKGGGTHRAGQGAYANMCRGGRMFAPTKVWRKWHRKTPKNQRRYAVCSALAASAVPALVMARGHRCDHVPEIPLVLENDFQKPRKTAAVKKVLWNFALSDEIIRCKKRTMRAGKGKMRNRRFRSRTGPVVIYAKDNGITLGIRNIKGFEAMSVYSLNLLKLCPGGHLGRLIIWTEAALDTVNALYGTSTRPAALKKDYRPPRPIMKNSDLRRLIMSPEVQGVVRPQKPKNQHKRKRNPLKWPDVMAKLNPDFAEQWEKIETRLKEQDDGLHVIRQPRTSALMKLIAKKRKISHRPFNEITLRKSDKQNYKEYWNNVFGDDKIFKSAKLLAAEKKKVAEAVTAAEREKAGADLLEMLQAEDAADNDSDS